MREIKFRVWDKITNQLVYLDEISFVNYGIDGENTGFELSLNGVGKENAQNKWLRAENEYVLQQFTGLKDKKGVEIYEGDILFFDKLNYLVEWVDYQWSASCPYYNKYHFPKFEYFNRESKCSEVIGNLFENSELLDKTK